MIWLVSCERWCNGRDGGAVFIDIWTACVRQVIWFTETRAFKLKEIDVPKFLHVPVVVGPKVAEKAPCTSTFIYNKLAIKNFDTLKTLGGGGGHENR